MNNTEQRQFMKQFEELLDDAVKKAMDAGGFMVGTDKLDNAIEKLIDFVEQGITEQ